MVVGVLFTRTGDDFVGWIGGSEGGRPSEGPGERRLLDSGSICCVVERWTGVVWNPSTDGKTGNWFGK